MMMLERMGRMGALVALLAAAGCMTGRDGDWAEHDDDLDGETLAAILAADEASGEGEEIEISVGIPFWFLPVIGGHEEDTVGRDDEGTVNGVYVESWGWLTPAMVARTEIHYRADGRLLGYEQTSWLALGILGGRESVRVREDGSLDFDDGGWLLWGLLGDY